MAGAVGLVSLHIFGFDDRAAPGHAEELGVGLQIVNIMRDVAEDAEPDRIYLPADAMAAHGVTEERHHGRRRDARLPGPDGRAGRPGPRFVARGERLLPLLDRRSRMCVAMLSGLYRQILDRDRGPRLRRHGRPRLAVGRARSSP